MRERSFPTATKSGFMESVLDCGGKRSATPPWQGPERVEVSARLVRSKAPSPLRSAGAVQPRGSMGVSWKGWKLAHLLVSTTM